MRKVLIVGYGNIGKVLDSGFIDLIEKIGKQKEE